MARKDTPICLKDTDLMPFGKHIGTPMQDVPAAYFHWLWTTSARHDKTSGVANYIRANKDVLEMETPDLIWD